MLKFTHYPAKQRDTAATEQLSNRLATRVLRRNMYCCVLPIILSLLFAFNILSNTAHANSNNNFSVYNVLYSQQENKLTVFSQLDLSLSNELIDAINNGVAVSIVIEYATPYESLLGQAYQTVAKTIFEIERHSLSCLLYTSPSPRDRG